MKMKAIIDRFESDKAVLLAGEREISVIWPKELLPAAKEGNVLTIEIVVDAEATIEAQAEADALFDQIMKQNQESNNQ